MKKIRVKFVDFEPGFIASSSKFVEILSKRYEVIFDDEPDYLFYSVYGYEYLKYDTVRIFYTGEQVSPDFDVCDYAIGFDYLEFGDRYIRYPLYFMRFGYNILEMKFRINQNRLKVTTERDFCSILVSNGYAVTNRIEVFEKLQKYKRVDSGGRIKNNIGRSVKDKTIFLSNYKFSITFENCSYNGYTTEKIVDAFLAHTVPIYFGNPLITNEFNPASFINGHSYETIDELVKEVIDIDQDDVRYINMLMAPKFSDKNSLSREVDLENFLSNIFDQSLKDASRRPFSQRSLRKRNLLLVEKKIVWLIAAIPKSVRSYIIKKL